MIPILLEVAESMSAGDGEKAALNRLASLALRATGADRSAILVRDSDRRRLLPAAGASRLGEPSKLWKLFRGMDPIDIGSEGAHVALWNAGTAVTLDDAESSPLVPKDWRAVWRSKSIAFAPLRAGGDTYGLLAVDYVDEPHFFTTDEAHLLEAISNAAGVALRSARLVEKLQRQIEVERRLAECTDAVRSGRSLNEVLGLVVDRFASLLPGVSCSINLLTADRSAIIPAVYHGPPPVRGGYLLSELPAKGVDQVRALWEADSRRPIQFAGLTAQDEWSSIIPPNIDVGMLLPLTDDNHVIGFLAAGRERRPFTDDEVALATSFADQAAIAVAQARLTETLQTRLKLIEALHRLSDEVVRTSNLKTLVNTLNRQVCEPLGIEIRRVTFSESSLCSLLRVPEPEPEERKILRSWSGIRATPTPRTGSLGLAIPVPMRNRVSGILWVTTLAHPDIAASELIPSIAAGFGEVASKARLRSLADRHSLELAVASDRERIARDLHDTVGQILYGIGLKLQDALDKATDPELVAKLESLKESASRGVADVRSAVYALSFLHVRARGFAPSLKQLAKQFSLTTGVPADVRLHGQIPRLEDDVEAALYRVAHEAFVNVDRHSRATGVLLSLETHGGNIVMTIQDDGVGIDQRQVSDWRSMAHFGMRMMARSVSEVGGTFTVRPVQPRGLLVQVSVPLHSRSSRT